MDNASQSLVGCRGRGTKRKEHRWRCHRQNAREPGRKEKVFARPVRQVPFICPPFRAFFLPLCNKTWFSRWNVRLCLLCSAEFLVSFSRRLDRKRTRLNFS